MADSKRSKTSSTVVWIIVGLLMFSMVGFGASGLSGTTKNIATVGDKPVSVQNYYRAAQNRIRQVEQQLGRSLTQAEVQTLGIDQQALSEVLSLRSLDQAASDMSLSIGDANVREQILSIPAFSSLSGAFNRQEYADVLKQNGLSEKEFEDSLRETTARNILQQAIIGDLQAPPIYAEKIAQFIGETRDFEWVKIENSDLTTGSPVPSQEDLNAFYTENSDLFKTPAAKRINYIWVTPDMILDRVTVQASDVQALYEERAETYNTPEMRIIDRLVFPNTQDANTAIDSINAGTATFDSVLEARGLTLADVDMGSVTQESLGDAGSAVFAVTNPGIVGPLETDLGPTIFRISAILDAQITTFDEISDELREEIGLIEAEQMLLSDAEEIDDLLAGGALLEEVAADTVMVLGQMDWNQGISHGIANYAEFQAAAETLSAADFPNLIEFPNGGFFAIEFVEDIPETLPELETVQLGVEAAWVKEQRAAALNSYVDGLITHIGDKSLSSLGYITVQSTDMGRTDFIDNTTPELISTVFEMKVGDVRRIQDADGIIIAKTKAVHTANLDTDESRNLQDLLTQKLSNQMSQDVFNSFARGVQNSLDIQLNENAITSVNSQIMSGNR